MSTIDLSDLTPAQRSVYDVLSEHGPLPDHALVPLTQHVSQERQSSSGIRTRRAELVDRGFARSTGESITMPSGRQAIIWSVSA